MLPVKFDAYNDRDKWIGYARKNLNGGYDCFLFRDGGTTPSDDAIISDYPAAVRWFRDRAAVSFTRIFNSRLDNSLTCSLANL